MARTPKPRNYRKNVTFTLIRANGTKERRHYRAAPRTLFNDKAVDNMLEKQAALLEKLFPGIDFRLVPLADGNFNLIEEKPVEA